MSATVISPVLASIWKMPSALPETIDQLWRLPTVSGSVAATRPTETPSAAFSARLKLWPALTVGVTSLTSLRLIVIVAVSDRLGDPSSVTSTSSVKLVALS